VPGRTVYLGDNPNDFTWPIPNGRGHDFEKLIGLYLKRHVATQDGRVRVEPTSTTGDAGRDFEIRFRGSLALFGFVIPARTPVAEDVVFVECKTTEHERLDDGFLADASQHGDGEACAYVLVTNAVITPYCQYRAQQEWGRRGTTFCLVDRRKLADVLNHYDMSHDATRSGVTVPDANFLPSFAPERLVVACQTEYRVETNAQSAHIYIAMANYGPEDVLSDLQLATDLQWRARQQRYERVIAPGMVENVRLVADRQEWNGPAEIGLNLSVNGRSQRLIVTRAGVELALDPPFLGAQHLRLAQDLRRLAETATGFKVVSITGEAGVGKSRTVDEALAPLIHGTYLRFTYHCSRQGLPMFSDCYEALSISGAADQLPDAARITELFRSAVGAGVPILLQFEDLHHSEEAVINVFKEVVLHSLVSKAPLVVILTGRDDHTFPNEAYYSLLQLVSDATGGHIHSFTLMPFTDEDARTLIRAVVRDMPEPGVDRVHALGQNNPFIIVEVLQYLLDARLAQILSRRTIGILNPEIFAGRNGLPETVEELCQQRLTALRAVRGGDLASRFIVVASFFGFRIVDDVRRAFFDGEPESDHAWSLLCGRRFFKEDAATGESTFAHENLLHHVRRHVRQAEHAVESAAIMLERPGLCQRLTPLDLGEVYYLHQDYPAAFECFSPVRSRVATVTNFSSEEIPRLYFAYLPAVFRTGRAVNAPAAFLAKVALAYGYMGVHNFPLVIAEDSCAMALMFLRELYPGDQDGLREKLAVAELRAHALQNMGRTGLALQQMLEVDATLRECGGDWPDVAFDLYDRLQEYYRKANHGALVHFYDRRARACVEQMRDEKLFAVHLITHSLVGLYHGQREARSRAAQAHEAAKRAGVRRLITYTRLTQLVVEALYSRQDLSSLGDIAAEARTMLQDAIVESFADSIMRLELLLGTLSLSLRVDEDERRAWARSYVTSGQANSVRYGNGLFDWAFDNLAAVIDLDDPRRVDEDVRMRFRTCLERLRQRGLTFLGAESGTYPNAFAISNIVRFFGGYQESVGVELLQGTLAAYDNRFAEDDRLARELVHRAVKGLPIFWPQKSRLPMLRHPAGTGYFTPVF
jgi:hypothetical protein